ncbi:hypothetical protein D0Z07_8255 [Hyphodiscus hymeniophilus]|uniref:ER-bound oxygenase mpaB/mpaB'/Rubber oxygenase catalytic domain-containing protein n=1 Tax=Hyphodiscus hymeniophilus TaxID=353542 RepID=A0A9P6SPX5_9HELO|nr:hypothetical protein D0Z07_8255 [Hyphodiscus hymeniophilus]
MAIPNPFRRHDENTRQAWGYTFQWTPEHPTREEMHPMKYSYDIVGEEALNRLDIISPPLSAELPRNQNRGPSQIGVTKPKRDLYALLKEHHAEDEKLGELWNEVNTVPEWVDWEQISRGQEVFYRYGGVALTALAFQSLLGGMGAGRVTEVLARTGGFSTKVARHRLYETTQHILQVTQSLDSIKPGGVGHASSIRVRLLHAAVRRRITKLAAEKPSYYSIEELGIPINDLDCIATIGTFSATLIWLGFPRQGIWIRDQEVQDYIALWRLVAYYMGTPTEPFETPAKAKRMMESLLVTEITPTATSKVLANNIILSLKGQAPTYASRDFLNANARWLNGNELADALGLGRPGLYYYALVVGQCIFFFENKTHGLGEETVFDFKYVPSFSLTTEEGVYEESATKQTGIEKRNFRTLVAASAALAVISYLGMRTTWGIVGGLRNWWGV